MSDPVEISAVMRECLEELVRQYAPWSDRVGGYSTGGLSTLATAFSLLGWADPHSCPEDRCDEPWCTRQATCGAPCGDRYRRTCGEHYPPATGKRYKRRDT